MALAVVIGCVGILVTVTLSILTRTRELALLRAVGMEPASLARTVLYEVIGLATASAVVGLVIGSLIFLPANLLFRELSGFVFGYSLPVMHVALVIVVAFVTALLSAIVPLRHLRRIEVLRAMEEE
jgi:putative ABC transport system permease protein